MDTIDIEDIRQHAKRNGSHWFDADSMRFFRSRVANEAYRSADGLRAWFVSSEQFVPTRGEPAPRKYSVRIANLAPDSGRGFIEEGPDGFQAYDSGASAKRAARRMAEQYDTEHKPEVA
jgi:hypothetical protein